MKEPKGTELFQTQLWGPPRLEKPVGNWSLAADQVTKAVSFLSSVQALKSARICGWPFIVACRKKGRRDT